MNANTSENKIKIPEQDQLKAGLYLVATPIGNLRDITQRALDTLRAVDKIACEDTRVSGKLLAAYDIRVPLIPYNDHSDENKRNGILSLIKNGKSVALISDAGSPLISDPGYKLVREAVKEGLYVTSIPGACAVVSALQLSGLPSDQFTFMGFLPNKQKARQDFLQGFSGLQTTLIAYETGPRLLSALEDILSVMGDRKVCIARELTKMFEQVITKSVSELITYYKESGAPKGEIALVIEEAEEVSWSDAEVEKHLAEALKTMTTKDAAAKLAALSGRPKKELYNKALELSGKS